MPTNFTMTGFLRPDGVIDDGTSVSWTSALHFGDGFDVVDVNDDGDMDIGLDYFFSDFATFSGYVIEFDGRDYAIFSAGGILYIPYDSAIADISGFTGPAWTSVKTDNADVVNCFATGTGIATPEGERAVETLAPGDSVTTADGRSVPILWIGRQTLRDVVNLPRTRRLVRVAAGALGGGLPRRDLTLTADHALALDGLLIDAGALANGTTIRVLTESDLPGPVTVWHIETEAHELLLAEGARAESFIDYRGRSDFDNGAAYLARHGAERTIPEMPLPRIAARHDTPPSQAPSPSFRHSSPMPDLSACSRCGRE